MVYFYPRRQKLEVWKFPLVPPDTGHDMSVAMPAGAKPLHVSFQGADLFLWALVAPENTEQTRLFQVYGTGHEIPQAVSLDIDYVGTAHSEGLVFHVFEHHKDRAEKSGQRIIG